MTFALHFNTSILFDFLTYYFWNVERKLLGYMLSEEVNKIGNCCCLVLFLIKLIMFLRK